MFVRKTFTVTQADYEMQAEVTIINEDAVVILTGGDVPHVGTVTATLKEALQVKLPELAEERREADQESVDFGTLRFPSHSGRFHKDDVLAEAFLAALEPELLKNVVVVAGVHVDGITKDQIAASYKMAATLGEQAGSWLTKAQPDTRVPRYYE